MTEDLPDGVYYDLPAETYHSLPRLSASGIKKLIISPIDFWASSFLNPNKRQKQNDAFNIGTAYHARICEGEAAFNDRYSVPPDVDRRTKVGKEEYAEWLDENPDCIVIEQDLFFEVMGASELIESGPLAHYFQGGQSEVSVLWHDEETNVPMKSRFDYIQPDKIVDLKTFSNTSDMDIDQVIFRSIAKYKYHLQAAVYFEAWRNMRKMAVLGTNPAAVNNPEFWFVFQKVGDAPLARAKRMMPDGLIGHQGHDMMRRGTSLFRDCWQEFGDNPWHVQAEPDVLRDEDFPLYVFD